VNFTNLFSFSDDSLKWFYIMVEKNDSALGLLRGKNDIFTKKQ
jgi:hypothetical protein